MNNEFFMNLSEEVSKISKDNSAKAGAVIVKNNNVISIGVNGFPNGCSNKSERYTNPELKKMWVIHAEEAAILNAAKSGISTENTIMYVNWYPCAQCARKIINAGIKKIICGTKPDFNHPRYGLSFVEANTMLNEADVNIEYSIIQRNIIIDVGNFDETKIENHIKSVMSLHKKND